MIPLAILLLAPLSLALSLFIETSSWWVRAQAPAGEVGMFVSRSNIYLYGGRFFTLAFTSLTAFWIESGGSPPGVSLLLASSLAFAAVFQLALLQTHRSLKLVMNIVAFSLRLPKPTIRPASRTRSRHTKLLFGTAASSFIFGLGIGAPLLAAVLVPEYRLSVSYLGQIINSFGTLVILLLVDQLLFKALDEGSLGEDVRDYGNGRILGFISGALIFLAMAAFLR